MFKFVIGSLVLGFSLQSFATVKETYKCYNAASGEQLEAVPAYGEITLIDADDNVIAQLDSMYAETKHVGDTKEIHFIHEEGDTVLVIVEKAADITATFENQKYTCTIR